MTRLPRLTEEQRALLGAGPLMDTAVWYALRRLLRHRRPLRLFPQPQPWSTELDSWWQLFQALLGADGCLAAHWNYTLSYQRFSSQRRAADQTWQWQRWSWRLGGCTGTWEVDAEGSTLGEAFCRALLAQDAEQLRRRPWRAPADLAVAPACEPPVLSPAPPLVVWGENVYVVDTPHEGHFVMLSHLSARDRTITRRVLEGETCRSVGLSYGLSPTRVYHIVQHTARQVSGWQKCPGGDPGLAAWRAWYRMTPGLLEENDEVPHAVPHLAP